MTVTKAVTSASPWFNEIQVRLANTSPITAMTVTVVVQRTTGVSYSGAVQHRGRTDHAGQREHHRRR